MADERTYLKQIVERLDRILYVLEKPQREAERNARAVREIDAAWKKGF